jgi:2-polyprenyl-6-methoxyphenol hydroxylase-like FAD-dependent oxidoreductase
MLPNLAQGGCQAIEDGAVLADALSYIVGRRARPCEYDSQRRKQVAEFARRSRWLRRVAHLWARSGSGCG